jgi:hypothetical protein
MPSPPLPSKTAFQNAALTSRSTFPVSSSTWSYAQAKQAVGGVVGLSQCQLSVRSASSSPGFFAQPSS